MVVLLDGPGGGGKADHVEDGGEDEAHEDGPRHSPEGDGVYGHPSGGRRRGHGRRLGRHDAHLVVVIPRR